MLKKSTVLLVSIGLALVSCGKVQNTLIVTNHSGVTADRVAVTVCGEVYLFSGLTNGGAQTRHFRVTGDSGFKVSATLADGTTLTNGFGYVTGGAGSYGNHASLEIRQDRQIIGHQP